MLPIRGLVFSSDVKTKKPHPCMLIWWTGGPLHGIVNVMTQPQPEEAGTPAGPVAISPMETGNAPSTLGFDTPTPGTEATVSFKADAPALPIDSRSNPLPCLAGYEI